MPRVARFLVWILVVGACLGFALITRAPRGESTAPARWFMPGALGFEPEGGGRRAEIPKTWETYKTGKTGKTEGGDGKSGTGPRTLRASAFLTRAMSGVDAEWGRRNGLTSRLEFSHNLSQVVPLALAKTRPEFFPWVDGKRLEPRSGAFYWNPDIARPDVAAHAAQAARDYFLAHPGEPSFALGVNDALIWGESPELLALATPAKWFRDRPNYSNVVFTFMNRVATELERTHPDKFVGALAYYWSEAVPDFPVHPQVIPYLTADRSQGYDSEFRQEEFELQAKWAAALRAGGRRTEDGRRRTEIPKTWETYKTGKTGKTGKTEGGDGGRTTEGGRRMREDGGRRTEDGRPRTEDGLNQQGEASLQSSPGAGVRHQASSVSTPASGVRPPTSGVSTSPRLGLYDYLYGGGFLIPRIHTRLLAEHLKHARKAGFTDYFAEVNANWGLDGPMPWLTAQLLQDPGASAEVLLEEYYRRYFQGAAAPMRRFFERCEESWMNQPGPPYWLKHYRNESQAVVFPLEACRELRQFLVEAAARAKPGKVRQRVTLVSDAFGVTERFVAFKSAKDKLTRLSLVTSAATGQGPLAGALQDFLEKRREFIRHTTNLCRREPLALHPFGWDDYLKNEPVALALRALAPEDGGRTTEIAKTWETYKIGKTGKTEDGNPARSEVLRDPGMAGPLQPARMIAGLPYGVSLPADWFSQVEPAQFQRAELMSGETGRILRISGSKDTSVSQWNAIRKAAEGMDELAGGRRSLDRLGALSLSNGGGTPLQRASITVRGKVSPGTLVGLVFSWLDGRERHVGFKAIRLPEGDWPEWVTLIQAGMPPAGAVWVGLGLRVQNQVPGDWVEAKGFSVREEQGQILKQQK